MLSFLISIPLNTEADIQPRVGQSWCLSRSDWFRAGHTTQAQPIRNILQDVSVEAKEKPLFSHKNRVTVDLEGANSHGPSRAGKPEGMKFQRQPVNCRGLIVCESQAAPGSIHA